MIASETRWWCAYDDGAVWPVEVVSKCYFYTTVLPIHPAPDAGEQKTVHPSRVYDKSFNRP